MDEIAVDGGEIVTAAERVQKMLAHPHQRRGTAGREVEPAQQFLPPRLGGQVHAGGSGIGGSGAPGLDRGREPLMVGTEIRRQTLEKRDPRARGQLFVAGQDLARERHAGGLAAPRQELLAKVDQIGGKLLGRRAAVAGHQRAAAICDRLQHVAEE